MKPHEHLEDAREVYANRLAQKLAPGAITQAIKDAGCFLVAYELLWPQIVEAVKGFFCIDLTESGYTYSDRWLELCDANSTPDQRRAAREYNGAIAFLRECAALTEEQILSLDEIRSHRNEIAHELPKLIVDPDFRIRTELIEAANDNMRAMTRFWGSIHVDTDPDFDDVEVDLDAIESGASALMGYVIELTRPSADDNSSTGKA